MDEMVKAIASRVTEVMPKAASFTSSQMATSSNGFDSSVMSTAATTGSSGSTVTDLGVVGRGVKRASIKPISSEPAAKKPALDSPSLQGDSSINSEVVPAMQTGDESVSK
jgi:HAT1-interacting factor 1